MDEIERLSSFWKEEGNYIFLREDDNVLILPPNRVYKINKTACKLLSYLKQGLSIQALFNSFSNKEQYDQSLLFFNVLYGLCMGDDDAQNLLERVPFTFNYTALPILGEIAVTYRCNNRCLFCYAGCNSDETLLKRKTSKKEMSTEKLFRIIDMFKNEAKIPFFSFTGGEPLIREDLESCISYAVSKGLSVNLVSNGTLATKERAESLFNAGLRTAQISIESCEEDMHNYLTGSLCAFNKTLEGIKNLMEAGISVQTNTTITNISAEHMAKMPAFLKKLGIKRFAMNMFIPSGSGLYHKELFISYADIGTIVDQVRKAAFNEGLTFFWYSPTPFCFYNPVAKGLGNKCCAAADGLISISPTGDVLSCSSWDHSLGNVLQKGFKKTWFSKEALKCKNKYYAPDVCKTCSSFTACQGACPLYWNYCGTELLSAKKRSDK